MVRGASDNFMNNPYVPPQRILLVEDDSAVHSALTEVLENEGFEVVHAASGAEAMDAARILDDIDLVILDLSLGDANGWDVFAALSARDPIIPIIIITAQPDQREIADAAGVGALLEKPLDIPRLLRVVGRLLRQPANARLRRLLGGNPHSLYYPSRESDRAAR